MASSFPEQIPVVIWVLSNLKPRRVLDIGKGFGKYGMLIHEYIGVDSESPPVPGRSLREQSGVLVDAVDINADYALPHLEQFYNRLTLADIRLAYSQFSGYDLILMIDVIEHLEKDDGLRIVDWFCRQGSHMLISTPKKFFNQHLYGSVAEHHVSHWTPEDFAGRNLIWQNCGPSRLYLLSPKPLRIRGFGNSILYRLRRLGRAMRNELG